MLHEEPVCVMSHTCSVKGYKLIGAEEYLVCSLPGDASSEAALVGSSPSTCPVSQHVLGARFLVYL